MKKIFVSFAAACGIALPAAAQDIIVKIGADSVRADVLEVSPSEVRYKRFSNPDGPTYVLPVSEISCIVYRNGERDTFAGSVATAATAESASASVRTAPLTVYRARPEIGKVYDDGTARGVVIALSDDMHGLMLSLEQSRYIPWTVIRAPHPETGAGDKADGRANMAAVERYIEANGLSWDDFPAFKWCRELGEGWYLPAIDELLNVGFVYNGSQRSSYNRRARVDMNERMKDAGGRKLDPMVDYYSSTDMGDGTVATGTMDINPPYVFYRPAHEKYLVRAVRRF